MRTAPIALLSLLLCLAAGRCSADYGVADTTKERAKELGIVVTSNPTPNHELRVVVEFEATGPMKRFNWADLDLTQNGKRLVTVALMPRKPTNQRVQTKTVDTVHLEFYIAPEGLPDTSVTLFVRDRELGGTGYRLRMKDFLSKATTR